MTKHILTSIAYNAISLIIALTASGIISQAQEYSYAPVQVSEEKVKIDGKVFYSHVVLERQTLYSLSKAYGVSIEDIYRYNPAVKESGLKKNSIVLIPVQEQRQARLDSLTAAASGVAPKAEPSQPRKTVYFKKWYETIEEIAARFNVTPESIIKENNLEGKKLNKRIRLIITQSDDHSHSDTESVTVKEDALREENLPKEDTTQILPTEPIRKMEIKASLLMPLKAVQGTSSRNNMDFYSGVLMAICDLTNEGITTELTVHDVAQTLTEITDQEAASADFAIGPVTASEISGLLRTVPDMKTVISPLDPRVESLIYTYENLIQVPTPQKVQYQDLTNWISTDFRPADKVILITEKGARETASESMMTEAMANSGLRYDVFSYSILEGRDVIGPLTALMTEEGTNRVLIASESEAFVNDAVRNLNLLIYEKLNIVLYAPSKIRSFETIEVENLHNANTHVSLSYYIDYDDENVRNFLMRYRALFKTEPTQFAYQGYDIARYFISINSRYGNDWKRHLASSDMEMLQSSFAFRKVENGGYVNHGIRRIIYDKGWKITKVR